MGRYTGIAVMVAVLALSGCHKANSHPNSSAAEYKRGQAYVKGSSVPKNYKKAVFWLKKAAVQGNAKAETAMGVVYAEGDGVPRNYSKAVYWLNKAASAGYAKAKNDLAFVHGSDEISIATGKELHAGSAEVSPAVAIRIKNWTTKTQLGGIAKEIKVVFEDQRTRAIIGTDTEFFNGPFMPGFTTPNKIFVPSITYFPTHPLPSINAVVFVDGPLHWHQLYSVPIMHAHVLTVCSSGSCIVYNGPFSKWVVVNLH